MKAVIILLTLVLMINSLYASNKFYFDNMQNQRNIMHKYYHAFIESHLTSNHKSILKVNYPPDYTDNLSTRYSFIQMYKIPVQTKFIVNLKDITNKNRRLAFYDNELSRRSNQKWHKHMQSIIVNAYHDFYNKSDFTPYLSMIFSGNFPQNSRPENYIDKIDKIDKSSNNEPLFDFFYALSFSSSYDINNKWSADFGAKYFYSGINKKMSNHENSINNNKNRQTTLKSINCIVGLTYRF